MRLRIAFSTIRYSSTKRALAWLGSLAFAFSSLANPGMADSEAEANATDSAATIQTSSVSAGQEEDDRSSTTAPRSKSEEKLEKLESSAEKAEARAEKERSKAEKAEVRHEHRLEKEAENAQKEGTAAKSEAANERSLEKAAEKASERDEKEKSKKGFVRRANAPCLCWVDGNAPPKAVILCVHGLGLHNSTYEPLGLRLSKSNIAVYAIDVRGFGSFMSAKGRERVDLDGCLEDVKATLKVLHRAHPGLPVFVLGESMGGAIALRATAMYPELIQGLVSSVPAGDRFKQGSTRLKVALHMLSSADKPFDVGTGIVNQATLKPELREAWTKDPLNKLHLSPNELVQFQHFMNQNHESAKLIKDKPVLFVQGCKDRLVRPEGTVELFNKLGTPDRKLELISNGEHLIFEENQFTEEDIKIVLHWLDQHLESHGVSAAPSVLQEQAKGNQ